MSVNWPIGMWLRYVWRVPRSKSGRTRTEDLLALVLYQSFAILFFGIPVFRDFRGSYIGTVSNDPGAYMWFLVWWPYAVAHHINPFVTKLVWAPIGYNLTWANSIPLPSLLAWPLTHAFGPFVAWNILCLVALALDAWIAFLLCRHLCNAFIPALVGGYLFGFSPYILGQLLGHLSLILVFPVPLAIYLVILFFEGRILALRFTITFALTVLLQFLCRDEIVASATVLGSFVILFALKMAGPESRRRLLAVCFLIASAFAIDAILLAPFLYYAFWTGFPHRPILSPYTFSSDLLSFLIPTPLLFAGRGSLTLSIVSRFSAGSCEGNAYIGVPLMLVIFDFAIKSRGNFARRLTLVATLIAAIASLGPRLCVAGLPTLPLPWVFFVSLPLINQALPARFAMYVFLGAAIITSAWLAESQRLRNWILVALGLISMIPNLASSFWITRPDIPAFFTAGTYRHYLAGGETALVLPYGDRDNSMLWQAATGMYFRMAGGYVSSTEPPEFWRWPLLSALYGGPPGADFDQELRAFLGAHAVTVIIVAEQAREPWARLLAPLGIRPTETEGVMFYRLPPGLLSARLPPVQQFAQRAALVAFSRIVIASDRYLAAELPMAKPADGEAQRLGLRLDLPVQPGDTRWWRRLWAAFAGPSVARLGMTGYYEDLRPVVECYAPEADQLLFPYPRSFRAVPPPAAYGQLSIAFTPPGLARAAAKASHILLHTDDPECVVSTR
jgi:hypothetical protein